MNTRRRICLLLAVTLLVATACAATRLTSAWKDETYLYLPAKKIFVIGAFSDAGVRRLFEQAVVAKLSEQGTEAVAGYAVFPVDRIPDHDALLSLMKEQQCDFVMVARFRGKIRAGVQETAKRSPAAPRELAALWREYYLQGFTAMPARSEVREFFSVETDLYETGEERPIWMCGGDLSVQGPVADQYGPFVSLLVGKMQADRIIPGVKK